MDVCIERLTPELADDFLGFFDRVAFTDNPRHARCYCQFYHTRCPNDEWELRTAEQNRSATREMIASGGMRGYLAYADGAPVGWCHADDMARLARLVDDCDGPEYTGRRVGVVVCFLVAPGCRRRGIAKALLRRACADFADRGFDLVEAYPRKNGGTDAENYLGPLAMYLADGFAIAGGTDVLHIVRKSL